MGRCAVTALDYSKLRHEAVRISRANLGYKETEGPNAGKFIRAMGGTDGAEWCALFAGYCYRRAYEECGYVLGPKAWMYRRPGKLELGAKALTKALGRVGRIFSTSGMPMPGDLVCWSRGILGWQGHVGIVTEPMHIRYGDNPAFKYIAGNEGRDGAVKERIAYYDNPKLWRFASVQP